MIGWDLCAHDSGNGGFFNLRLPGESHRMASETSYKMLSGTWISLYDVEGLTANEVPGIYQRRVREVGGFFVRGVLSQCRVSWVHDKWKY
jgi:hypothetical protein